MKNFVKKSLSMFLLAILSLGTAIYTGGCREDNELEEVGEETQETMEEAGDETEEALD